MAFKTNQKLSQATAVNNINCMTGFIDFGSFLLFGKSLGI